MKPEVKKALELIKSELSREDQVKALFIDKHGEINLSKLKLTGLDVNLDELKARLISNAGQEANYINNNWQKSKLITNRWQQAEYISNKNQKLN